MFWRFFLRRYRAAVTNGRLLFAVLCITVFFYTTLGFYLLEEVTISKALWWAVVTMTTVGYGDVTPQKELTRLVVGYPAILLGVMFVGYVLSDISMQLLETARTKRKGLRKMTNSGHVVIIRFVGESRMENIVAEIAKENVALQDNIVVIDDEIEELHPSLAMNFVRGDPTIPSTLEKANLSKAHTAIVFRKPNCDATRSDLQAIAIILAIRQQAPELPIISECADAKHLPLLKNAGSNQVVCLEEMREQIIVQELLDPGVVSIVHELTSNLSGNQLYIVDAPRGHQTYQDIKVYCQPRDLCLLGIRRGNNNFLAPQPTFAIEENDRLICIATTRPRL